ncbi:hypothetical protein JYK14_06310 [Siccirubricoccus sp. KC 17139]|uniref:Uncharacterized protein n=1 Tax=Siccirubricoccus soli TaxID=2899147 RepID=A0ABT1D1J4_9PROT|nr:hypothetical protein [Siccirubricoccus soli]MCP2681924.1 hypothetical protein [Siccirubricoccus soli]
MTSFIRTTRFRLDGRFYVLTEKSLTEDGEPAWIARRDDQVAVLFAEEVLLLRYAERDLDFVVVSQDQPNVPARPEVPPDLDEFAPGDRARITVRRAFLMALPRKLREANVDDTPRSLRRGAPAATAAIEEAWQKATGAAKARATTLLAQPEPGPLNRKLAKRLLAEAEGTAPAPKTIAAWRRLDDPQNSAGLAGKLSNSGNRKQMPPLDARHHRPDRARRAR